MRPAPQREGESDQAFRDRVEEGDRRWRERLESQSSIITRPTRDLNKSGYRQTEKERERGRFDGPRWQDQEVPQDTVWTGGSRDFDERSGTYRPGNRPEPWGRGREWVIEGGIRPDPGDRAEVQGGGPEYWKRKRREERRDKRGGWWNEPRRPAPYTPTSGLPTDSDRFALLTGEGSRPEEAVADRFKLLTGESDYIPTPLADEVPSKWRSQYGGREEYDPQDREFNRRFSERPRGRQPWEFDYKEDPIEKDPLADYDFQAGKGRGETHPWGSRIGYTGPGTMDFIDSDGDRTDDRYQTGPGAPRELPSYESYDDTDLKKRLAALEERGSIVTQPTQDLSGITGRLSKLEGRQPSWQEDRIKALEGRKPDTSWKDPLAAVQAGQTQGQQARSALDTRLAALENYYKNDPPPADSVGNRYEDKYNQLNKLWEREGKAQKWGDDALKETGYLGKDHWDYGYANDQGQAWAGDLPEGYVQGIRDLNREYNRPTLEAIIKGREYKAYDPRAAARLRYLDEQNIHEDTYLGSGTWKNQYGEEVTGRGQGDQDRYFKSQSGLDRESDEYKDRFAKKSNYGNTKTWGKDYAWYR